MRFYAHKTKHIYSKDCNKLPITMRAATIIAQKVPPIMNGSIRQSSDDEWKYTGEKAANDQSITSQSKSSTCNRKGYSQMKEKHFGYLRNFFWMTVNWFLELEIGFDHHWAEALRSIEFWEISAIKSSKKNVSKLTKCPNSPPFPLPKHSWYYTAAVEIELLKNDILLFLRLFPYL